MILQYTLTLPFDIEKEQKVSGKSFVQGVDGPGKSIITSSKSQAAKHTDFHLQHVDHTLVRFVHYVSPHKKMLVPT